MKIPFNNLSLAVRPIHKEIEDALSRVVRSGWFLRGEETLSFEREWASYCGQRHCIGLANGTDAVHLAALAGGIKTATIPAPTCWYTAEGLHRAGCRVIIGDVNPNGTQKVVDTVSVPLYGRPPDRFSHERAVMVDAAQAHGWKPNEQHTCAWSFYPTKNLGALGDAGAVTTNNEEVARLVRLLAGADDVYRNADQIVSRMDEMQAAVLRVKLRHLDRWNEERRIIAGWYWDRLTAVSPVVRPAEGTHHLFPVICSDRDRITAALDAKGIGYKIHYPTPLHHYPAVWARDQQPCPAAEQWCRSVLSLPCYPGLTEKEVQEVCEVVNT